MWNRISDRYVSEYESNENETWGALIGSSHKWTAIYN